MPLHVTACLYEFNLFIVLDDFLNNASLELETLTISRYASQQLLTS